MKYFCASASMFLALSLFVLAIADEAKITRNIAAINTHQSKMKDVSVKSN